MEAERVKEVRRKLRVAVVVLEKIEVLGFTQSTRMGWSSRKRKNSVGTRWLDAHGAGGSAGAAEGRLRRRPRAIRWQLRAGVGAGMCGIVQMQVTSNMRTERREVVQTWRFASAAGTVHKSDDEVGCVAKDSKHRKTPHAGRVPLECYDNGHTAKEKATAHAEIASSKEAERQMVNPMDSVMPAKWAARWRWS